jgi:hypothetical protein
MLDQFVVVTLGEQISQPLLVVAPEPWKVPAIQQPETQLAGLPLQTSPEGHPAFAPSALVHADVLVPGWQVSHGSLGFAAPDATIPAPGISHWLPQAPPLQISPPPHVLPAVALVHADVLDPGVHISQPLFAVAPGLWNTPPIEQPDVQLPASQTWPEGQLAAPLTSVQDDELEVGVQTSHPLCAVAPGAWNVPPM